MVAIVVAAVLAAGAVTAGNILGLGAATSVALGARSTTTAASGTAAERAEASWPAPKPIAWSTCSDSSLAGTARCGFLTVPLDWSTPRGATIKLAVSEVLHTGGDYRGVMLVNPGGPGASGLDLSLQGASVPDGVGDRYDWIGFDPRGVGSSVPALTCEADYATGPRPAYQPDTEAVEQTWLAKAKGYASACATNGGALLDHMTTADTARDMEYLRMALGAKRISYYGYSYGTYLGEVYSTLFPDRLDRMVLDSTVDPRTYWYGGDLAQDVAFQKNVDAWFAWVASHDAEYGLGSTAAAVERTFDAEEAALAAHPADGQVGADEWSDVFLYAGYYQSYWTTLGRVFALAVRGDTSGLLSAYRELLQPTDDNGYVGYLAVQCTDAPSPTSFSTWRTDNARVAKTAPFETWANAWFNAPCLYWPAKAHVPVKITGTAAPILMIDQTLDAATPYEGSLYVRSIYTNASLLAVPGGRSHAVSLDGDACVDDTIARYLATGERPTRKAGSGADATCAAPVLPSP